MENSLKVHWQWITAQNYARLGYADEQIGCILIQSPNSEDAVLSHDDEFSDFFAMHNISPMEQEGTI